MNDHEFKFIKFVTFQNEKVDKFAAMKYNHQNHGQIQVNNLNNVHVCGYSVCESFKTHCKDMIEIAKHQINVDFPFQLWCNYVLDPPLIDNTNLSTLYPSDDNSNNSSHNTNTISSPILISSSFSKTFTTPPINLQKQETQHTRHIAHIITYELWLESMLLVKHMKTRGSFPFEVYFTKLLQSMINTCSGIYVFQSQQADIVEPLCQNQNGFNINSSKSFQQYWNVQYPLLQHQLASLQWMCDLEKQINCNCAKIEYNVNSVPIVDTGFYYNLKHNIVTRVDDEQYSLIQIRGGILADITGSGKSAIALALIVADLPRQTHMTQLQKELFFCSNATLIITPVGLLSQWMLEIQKFSINLKVIMITNQRDLKRVKLDQLLQADIVLVTDTILSLHRYEEEIHNFAVNNVKPEIQCDAKFNIRNISQRMEVYKKQIPSELETSLLRSPQLAPISLDSIKWKRVIIDEIHAFLFSKHKIISRIIANYYWGLTGTPMFQHAKTLQNYVQFISEKPQHWVPQFTENFLQKCCHQFVQLQLGSIVKNLFIIEPTLREKQLILSCTYELADKQIQVCSYWNIIEPHNKINFKTMSIEELISITTKKKHLILKQLLTKIECHELAILNISTKIEESVALLSKQKIQESQPQPQPLNIQVIDITPLDVRDTCDLNRGRRSRIHRMTHEKNKLREQHQTLKKNMNFIESKLNSIKSKTVEMCPICMSQPCNVILQCGHMYCRPCIIRCLKQKMICPCCNCVIKSSQTHEICLGDQEICGHEVQLYGSKLARILELVKSIPEKVILFVQWVNLANIMRNMFEKHNISVAVVMGNIIQQNAALKKFKTGSCQVLIGMINTTGLDLSHSNHLIFTHALFGEKCIVKAMEEQSIARIHRMGQTRPVHVYWFITRETIEEKIYLQTRD